MNHAAMGAHAWAGAPVTFVATWMAMMVPMMLPSLAPALRAYHRVIHASGVARHPARSTAAMAAGYYAVWAGVGAVLLALGAALAVVSRRLPALAHGDPFVTGVVVLVAGILQLTAWKAHHLACCGAVSMRGQGAWRDGVRLGVHCCLSCTGPMAVLLAVGVMDLRAMAVVTAAITAERVAPDGRRVARVIGALGIAVGLALVARAASSAMVARSSSSLHFMREPRSRRTDIVRRPVTPCAHSRRS